MIKTRSGIKSVQMVAKAESSPLIAEAGKMFAQNLIKMEGHNEAFKLKLTEKYGINFKEDVTTTTASGAYTTLLSDAIFTSGVRNIDNILRLVDISEELKTAGTGAIQVPIEQNAIAVRISEGSAVTYYNEGITSVTATPEKRVAATKITWEMIHRGMAGFAQRIMNQAAVAVERKLGQDIVNGLSLGANAANTVTGGVTYGNVITAQARVNAATDSNGVAYDFHADKFVVTPTSYATLRQDTDYKAHVGYAVVVPSGDLRIDRPVPMFHEMEVVETSLFTNALAMVLDSKRAGILVKESDLEFEEGRINGSLDSEIIAVMSYVLIVAHSYAIANITA